MTLRPQHRKGKAPPAHAQVEEVEDTPVISYYNPFRNHKGNSRQKSTSRYEEVEDDETQRYSNEPSEVENFTLATEPIYQVRAGGGGVGAPGGQVIETEPPYAGGYQDTGYYAQEQPYTPSYPAASSEDAYSEQGFPREVEPRHHTRKPPRNKPRAEDLPVQRAPVPKKRREQSQERGRPRKIQEPRYPASAMVQQEQGADSDYTQYYPAHQGTRGPSASGNYTSTGGSMTGAELWGAAAAAGGGGVFPTSQYGSNHTGHTTPTPPLPQQPGFNQQDMYRMMAPMFSQMMQDFVNKSRSASPAPPYMNQSPQPSFPGAGASSYQRQRSNSPMAYTYSQMHTPNPHKYQGGGHTGQSKPSSYNNTLQQPVFAATPSETPQTASRQDVEDLKSQTAQLSTQLQSFSKIIEDLKISVSEKDVEIFRLNLALGDEKKRSQNLTSQLRDGSGSGPSGFMKSTTSRRNLDTLMSSAVETHHPNYPFNGQPPNLMSDDYAEGNDGGVSHSRTHSIRTGPTKPVEMRPVEVQTEIELYEAALRDQEEGVLEESKLAQLVDENKALRLKLQEERQATELQRNQLEQQLEAERNANTESIEQLENRSNELSAEHTHYLQTMRREREQWAEERKRYELDLRDKQKSIGEMTRKIDKHQADVQKAVKIHKANKELAESNIKLKADIKNAKERWDKRTGDQQSKIQYLEESLSTLKASLRTSESKVCNNCAAHLKERDELEDSYKAKKREIEAKKMAYAREQENLLVQQEEYEEKLRSQPAEIEAKMGELEAKLEEQKSQKQELEEQIRTTSRDITEKDELIGRMDVELGSVRQEYEKFESKDKENQSVIDQVMERVARANALVEEQRATNRRLKQQLTRDATNIVEMTTNEAQLEEQINSLNHQITGLEVLMPKKKH